MKITDLSNSINICKLCRYSYVGFCHKFGIYYLWHINPQVGSTKCDMFDKYDSYNTIAVNVKQISTKY